MAPKYTITHENSCWVFLAGSPEPRHLDDTVFGAATLLACGVRHQDLLIFSDNPDAHVRLKPYGFAPRLRHPSQLDSELASLSGYRHIVVVCGGHGTAQGLDVKPVTVTPSTLIKAIRGCPGIECAFLVLCQCYAGVFNYLDAASQPPIIIAGCTNFHPSQSLQICINKPVLDASGSPALCNWNANAFQFMLFNWLRAPVDVDGDGHTTLIDAYKHAAVRANELIQAGWVATYEQSKVLADRLDSARKKAAAAPNDAGVIVELQAAEKDFRMSAAMLYYIQEPWLLHANLARDVAIAWTPPTGTTPVAPTGACGPKPTSLAQKALAWAGRYGPSLPLPLRVRALAGKALRLLMHG